MRIRQFIPVLFALLMPMVAVAQGPLDVMPTATYTDDEGNLATADKDNPDISGQAPLFVNFYANPTDMGVYIPSYEWHFRMQGEEKDFMVRYEENTDYTFTTAGTTLVTLRTTLNQGELEIDSVTTPSRSRNTRASWSSTPISSTAGARSSTSGLIPPATAGTAPTRART